MPIITVKMEREQARQILEVQHWRDLLEALQRESDQVDGWGEVTIRLVYHEGLPREMEVVSLVTRCKLGKTLSPLTGRIRGIRVQVGE